MGPLREALEGAGLIDVVTILQSGNVVASSDLAAGAIGSLVEAAVLASSGTVTRCLTLEADDLRRLWSSPPTSTDLEPAKVLVVTMDRRPTSGALAELEHLDAGRTEVVGRMIVQRCPDGIARAPGLVAVAERRWSVVATSRNLATMRRVTDAMG